MATTDRICTLIVVAMLGVVIGLVSAVSAQLEPLPLELGSPERVTASITLGQPIDSAVAPDGAFVIADLFDNVIYKLSADGNVEWQRGRRGEGPGEFNTLYRVAVSDDGVVSAYDMARQDVTRFSPEGDYLDRIRLPFRMSVVDKVLTHPDGTITVCGVANDPAVADYAVHRFDPTFRHIRSFGPLPVVQERSSLDFWGAGGCSRTEDDDVLYTRRIPYEIYRFSLDGEFIDKVVRAYEFPLGPDDSHIVEESEETGRITTATAPEFVPRPWTAQELDSGWLVAGVITAPRTGIWDLFNRATVAATIPGPNGWSHITAVDRRKKVVYVKAETEDGNHEYLRIPYAIGTAGR